MNKRILELAKQAGLKYSAETQLSPAEANFAELIIKECIKVVDLWCDEVPCSEGYDKFTVSKLKERFGIEE